jgi:putative NADH-flavin reductase
MEAAIQPAMIAPGQKRAMRFFVFGATGRTGVEIIDLALARGHQVTAFGRSPTKISRRHERLKVVGGDPRRADEIIPALRSHDAVLSALGPREPFRTTTLLQDSAASAIQAMTAVGLKRILLVSQALLFPGGGPLYALGRFFLRRPVRDSTEMERIVMASLLEWTIVRPPRLIHAREEKYRARDERMPDGLVVSWRALAAFLLDAAERGEHVRKIVGLSR